jgi:hypothetical protein
MPLIKKGILIEGPNSETLVREYYIDEKRPNPYAHPEGTLLERRHRKVRQLMSRKGAPDPHPYTWTIGYNHCIGTHSPGGNYCPFGGSSLNRNKMLKKDYDPINPKTIIPAKAGTAMALAYTSARGFYRRGEPLPDPLRDYLALPDAQNEGKFRVWLSEQIEGGDDGLFFSIYVLSSRSRGKIKDKATAFFRSCPGERVFCTLSFVSPVSDRIGVAILNKFLTQLRKEFKSLQYLWVAERQDNGNIHFHIILNKRLPIRKYNALWVLQQYNSGLRGQTQFGVPVGLAEIEQRYKSGSIHRVFNPVDVKRVRSIAGLSSYLTKYITKQKRDVYFGCLPWHCSRGVSKLFTKATVGPSVFSYMMSLANCKLDKSTGEVFMPRALRPKAFALAILVYVNKKDAPLRYLREMEQINKWLIKGMEVDRGYLDCIDDDSHRKWFCKN